MSKIKDFLKSPLGTALCAALGPSRDGILFQRGVAAPARIIFQPGPDKLKGAERGQAPKPRQNKPGSHPRFHAAYTPLLRR